MRLSKPQTSRCALVAAVTAVLTVAGAASQAFGQFSMPKISAPKIHVPKVSAPKMHVPQPSMPKVSMPKMPKVGSFQQKLGTEMAAGAVGGAAAGATFGSFAGPAGTVAGAGGGAVAGAAGAGVGYTFKNHAKKHWGWK